MEIVNLRKHLKKEFSCNNVKSLTNVGNSCYMDVVLFSLLAIPNEFVNRFILNHGERKQMIKDFQETLLQIAYNLRFSKEISSCAKIKAVLSKYKNELKAFPAFYTSNQYEALEFLQLIFRLYNLNGMKDVGCWIEFSKRFGVTTMVSKKEKTIQWFPWIERIDKKSSAIYIVPYLDFQLPNRTFHRFLDMTATSDNLIGAKFKNCPVNTSEERKRVQRFSDLFVIAVQRENPFDMTVDHRKVQIPTTLSDDENKTIRLYSVIVHIGESINAGHYVSFTRCGTQWIFFDDLDDELVVLNSWNQVQQHKVYGEATVAKNGVLFFYSAS